MSDIRNNPYEVAMAGIDTNKDNIRYDYTPVWTAVTVNPALGNGTLTGAFSKHRDFYLVTITLTIGGTTALGTGAWMFSIPTVAAKAYCGAALMFHGATGYYTGVSSAAANTQTVLAYYSTATTNPVGPAVPFAWAAGDALILTLEYPIR